MTSRPVNSGGAERQASTTPKSPRAPHSKAKRDKETGKSENRTPKTQTSENQERCGQDLFEEGRKGKNNEGERERLRETEREVKGKIQTKEKNM